MSQISFILQKEGSSVFKDSGSKFLGFAFPVNSVEDVKEKLELLHQQFPDATHICSAWCLGMDKWRASDDGEPAHSAGSPILRQIQSMELTNTLVAVVRYYGGKKLGVPGLIYAYGESARLALENGKLADYKTYSQVRISFSYMLEGEVNKILRRYSAQMRNQVFAEQATMTLEVESVVFPDFLKDLEHIYGLSILEAKL